MESIIEIITAAMIFVGSWGFSYGYHFDSNCFTHDYLIQREFGIRDTFVLTLNEDGTAIMNKDGILFEGEWTNQDGLKEYSVSFPQQGLNYTMTIEGEDSANFEPGMLCLDDFSGTFVRYCFQKVWQCEECLSYNGKDSKFCSQCGAAKKDH